MANLKIAFCRNALHLRGDILNQRGLADCEVPMYITDYDDGEIFVQYKGDIRDDILFAVQSLNGPLRNPNDLLMELCIMGDAARRADVKKMICVLPYLSYARQDWKPKSRIPITVKMVIDFIVEAGYERVIAMDLHASQIQGMANIPFDHLFGSCVFIPLLEQIGMSMENVVFGSTDAGGSKRVKEFAKYFDTGFFLSDKTRTGPGKLAEDGFSVTKLDKGKKIILLDDLCASSGTLVDLSLWLQERFDPKSIEAITTNGLFTGDAITKIMESPIQKLRVTDGIPGTEESLACEKIEYAASGPLLGKVIHSSFHGQSLSPLFPSSV